MISGVGMDMVEVDRLGEKVGDQAFRDKVFSRAEVLYCESQQKKSEHYAARFAAKEAFLKATGLGLTAGHDLFEIEVISDHVGKPGIQLHGNFLTLAREHHWNKIHLSLSHVRAMACAVVILES